MTMGTIDREILDLDLATAKLYSLPSVLCPKKRFAFGPRNHTGPLKAYGARVCVSFVRNSTPVLYPSL